MAYKLFEGTYKGECLGDYISYGIKNKDFVIHDISTNKELVEKLTAKLNKHNDISNEHLYDIIDDFLASL